MNAVTTVTGKQPRSDSSLLGLASFLRSFLSPKQIADVVALLNHDASVMASLPGSSVVVLDPESAQSKLQVAIDQPAASRSIDDLLQEMETAYSIEKFAPLTADESRRVRDSFPGFIERCSANQGRHLVKMLKEKLKMEKS
jgi:hypothetical protein